MKCVLCGYQLVSKKVTIDLKKEKPCMCQKCEAKYLPNIHLTKIPIKNYFIWHFYICEKTIPDRVKSAFDQYFRPYYLLASAYQKPVIVLDELPSSELFDLIDLLDFGDIMLFTYDYGKEQDDEN